MDVSSLELHHLFMNVPSMLVIHHIFSPSIKTPSKKVSFSAIDIQYADSMHSITDRVVQQWDDFYHHDKPGWTNAQKKALLVY